MPTDVTNKTLVLLSQTDGRDKIYKVVQYGSRLLWWLAHTQDSTSPSPSNTLLLSRLARLDSSLSDARRVFRLGGFIRGFVSAIRESAGNMTFLHSFKFLSVLSNFAMESMDVIIWGAKIKVINANKRQWDWWHNFLWMIGIFYIFTDQINALTRTLAQRTHLLQQKKDFERSSDLQLKERKKLINKEIAGVHEQLVNIIYTFIRYGCDFYMCTALLCDREHRGMFGLMGSISGILGLMQSWKKL